MPHALEPRRRDRRRLIRRVACLGTAVLSALCLVAVIVAGSVSASAAPASADLCDQQVTPGHATCFAVRNTGMTPMVAGTPAGYGPADLQSAYALPASTGGTGQTVYVIDAYDDPTAESDLATYRSTYGLPTCTTANGCFGKMNQNGGSSPLPAANSGWRGEISLDLDMVSAICPNCSIRLVEASDTGSGLYTAVQTAVTKGAKFVSMSWGGPEWAGETQQDSVFATSGVLFAASSGDNAYAAGVSYPSASPYVLSVGGTRLSPASNGRGWTETAWGTGASSGAGSGCSLYEPKPAWQSFIADSTCPRRADTDVSAEADPGTGVAVYNAGAWGVYGGTSASAPIVTSIYALAGPPASSDRPSTYPYTNVSSLNDVISGSNGSCGGSSLCTAGTGWDGPTGLGTPDGIGAFNGTGSSTPIITVLGGSIGADAEVPGLAANVHVTPLVPTGQTLTSVTWKASRSDCVFADPTAAQTTVTCGAAATGSATLTATLKASGGTSKALTTKLAFTTSGGKRAVDITMSVDSQTSAASLCIGNAAPAVVQVVDHATGQPVKGVNVVFSRQDANRTKPSSAGTVSTAITGTATKAISATLSSTFSAYAAATGLYLASAPLSTAVTVAKCTPSLAATTSSTTPWYGQVVTVTGTLTRPAPSGSGTIPVSGVPVSVLVTPPPKVATNGKITVVAASKLASATTAADGTYTATFKAATAGELTAQVAGTAGLVATGVDLGAMTVSIPTTTLGAQSSADELMYGDKMTVTGSLTTTADSAAPMAGTSVTVKLLADGAKSASTLGTARTASDGTFTLTVGPVASGQLSAVYAGAAGRPAATVQIGSVAVDSWTPTVSLIGAAPAVAKGATVTYSGTLTRTGSAGTEPAKSVGVKLVLTPSAGGAPITLGSVTTSTAGAFSLRATPKVSGTVTAIVSNVKGYTNASSEGVSITVS